LRYTSLNSNAGGVCLEDSMDVHDRSADEKTMEISADVYRL
jgi:hypothetical protein